MDTTQLVLRARGGDVQAVNELYYASYKQPYAVALQMTGNEKQAYDIIQEAYYKAFGNLDLLSDKSDFVSWFNKIAVNVLTGFFRSRLNISLTFPGGFEGAFEGVGEFKPSANVDYINAAQAADAALGSLSPEKKLVFLMYFVQEMSVSDIAEALGASEGAVDHQLSLASAELSGRFPGTVSDISADEFVPFTVWRLRQITGGIAVHEMEPAVREAASSENTIRSNEATKAEIKRLKKRVKLISAISIGVFMLLAGAFCFFAFALPAITGEQNPVSSAMPWNKGSEDSVKEGSPEALIRDLETAVNNHDNLAMAKLYAPDVRTQREAEGFGMNLIYDTLEKYTGDKTDVELKMSDLKYDGDAATAKVKVVFKVVDVELPGLDFKADFVKQDGVWYINNFKFGS